MAGPQQPGTCSPPTASSTGDAHLGLCPAHLVLSVHATVCSLHSGEAGWRSGARAAPRGRPLTCRKKRDGRASGQQDLESTAARAPTTFLLAHSTRLTMGSCTVRLCVAITQLDRAGGIELDRDQPGSGRTTVTCWPCLLPPGIAQRQLTSVLCGQLLPRRAPREPTTKPPSNSWRGY